MSAAGTWNLKIDTPMGEQEATLEVTLNGTEATGSFSTVFGPLTLNDGKYEGDTLTYNVDWTVPIPMKLEFEGKVDGDTYNGVAKMGVMGDSNFTGTRA